MSTYYILMPGDTEKDCINDTNILGESSFDKFYSGLGLKALMRIVETKPEILPNITIKTDTNKTLTIEQFLTEIQGLKIIS